MITTKFSVGSQSIFKSKLIRKGEQRSALAMASIKLVGGLAADERVEHLGFKQRDYEANKASLDNEHD
jgi:hypothetical protein